MNFPGEPSSDRRRVPRHLRDTEHQPLPETPGSGMRRGDVPTRRPARGVILLVVAAAALALGLWLGSGVPAGIASLGGAVICGVFASLSFRRR